jgi:hypothetical protein
VDPMEPWERVWIDAENYSQDIHSYINCTACHGGQSDTDMNVAHTNMIADPSDNAVVMDTCGSCHPTITTHSMNSLHSTLRGYDTVLHARSEPEHFEQIAVMEANHCDSCHATCGDCHVAQPNSVGSGLLEGHSFVEPPMSRSCTACHGSRVKDEYYGVHEGLSPDVHFQNFMSCNDCHSADSLHGITTEGDVHRYDGEQDPTCESCHQEQVGVGSGIYQHEIHGTEDLSCQVCHSVAYTSCVNCHVDVTEDGRPFFGVEDYYLGFFIGRNPRQSAERPYEWVPVRHVPIDRDSFSAYGIDNPDYGEELLPNFDVLPTWKYASPHNIQRNTPQTESCLSCHGNPDVFLTIDNVRERDLAANQGVIVTNVPPLPEGYENVITNPVEPTSDDASDDTSSETEDFFGGGDDAGDDDEATEDFFGGSDDDDGSDDESTEDFFGGGDDAGEDDSNDDVSTEDFFGS